MTVNNHNTRTIFVLFYHFRKVRSIEQENRWVHRSSGLVLYYLPSPIPPWTQIKVNQRTVSDPPLDGHWVSSSNGTPNKNGRRYRDYFIFLLLSKSLWWLQKTRKPILEIRRRLTSMSVRPIYLLLSEDRSLDRRVKRGVGRWDRKKKMEVINNSWMVYDPRCYLPLIRVCFYILRTEDGSLSRITSFSSSVKTSSRYSTLDTHLYLFVVLSYSLADYFLFWFTRGYYRRPTLLCNV